VGENFGLTKTRIMKSVRNSVITYFMGKKLFLKMISIKETNVAKNSKPADALSSFKTGMLYPSHLRILAVCSFFQFFYYKCVEYIKIQAFPT
jgi:hypothetical protein